MVNSEYNTSQGISRAVRETWVTGFRFEKET